MKKISPKTVFILAVVIVIAVVLWQSRRLSEEVIDAVIENDTD